MIRISSSGLGRTWLLAIFSLFAGPVFGQYISTCETVPFACPSVCTGSSFTVKVFQLQRLGNGAQVQGELSGPSGAYGAGGQLLPVEAYSTNGGGSYVPGPYIFRGDASDVLLRFAIPAGTPLGSGYNFRIRSGNSVGDNFRCPGNGRISVAPGQPLAQPVGQDAIGVNQWLAHFYTWTPTTTAPLVTPGLVGQQRFFNPSRYQGHAVYNALSLDLNFTQEGGAPGTQPQASTFGCGNILQSQYSIRMRRRQTFAPGLYRLSIQGDDGIRLSWDGGATWGLSRWFDQRYDTSLATTDAAYPGGICLAGEVDLVLEFFQNPREARLTVGIESLTAAPQQPQPQTVCPGQQATFTYGAPSSLGPFQWAVSADGGATFADLAEGGNYQGTNTPILTIRQAQAGGPLWFRCRSISACFAGRPSDTARLTVLPGLAFTQQPAPAELCPGDTARLYAEAPGALTYQWQVEEGNTYVDLLRIPGQDTRLNSLQFVPTAAQLGRRYRLVASGPCGQATSEAATLSRCCNIGELPSLLSPNMDGLNDRFGGFTCDFEAFSLRVYSRWGRLVFTTEVPTQSWDLAKVLPGTYFYRLAYTRQGLSVERRGFVEVVR